MNRFIQLFREQNYPEAYQVASELVNEAKYDSAKGEWHLYNLGFILDKVPRLLLTEDKLNIAILSHRWTAEWSPSSPTLSEAEEAIHHSAELLAKMGHQVVVFANPPKAAWPWTSQLCNPRYCIASAYGRTLPPGRHNQEDQRHILDRPDDDPSVQVLVDTFDLCITCQTDFELAKRHADRVFFLPQDSWWSPLNLENCDGVLWLSEWQKRTCVEKQKELSEVPSVIAGYGGPPVSTKSRKQRKNPYACGYFGGYEKGLELLLEVWPDIKSCFPKATLEIVESESTPLITKKIRALEELGVKVILPAGLSATMNRLSLWTYPCTKSENFCSVALRAQAAGMIPVVVTSGGLDATILKSEYTVPLEGDNLKQCYLDTVLLAMKQVNEIDRSNYTNFASHFPWSEVIEKWLQLYVTIE